MRRNLLIPLVLSLAVPAQAPHVVSTNPARHTRVGPFDPIHVTFATPIQPATVTNMSFSVFGDWTGAVPGILSVDATATIVTFQPTVPLFVGDVVSIDLSNAIRSAAGIALAGGYHFQVTVRSNPGSGVFQQTQTIPFRQPGEGPLSTYGISAGDVDRDGSPDITAINEDSHDLRVFKNNGCAGWSPMTITQDGQNVPSPHATADFNRDGWLDITTGDYFFGNVSVYLNDGTGSYLPPIGLAGNSYIRSLGAGDLNGDGYPDIVAGNGGVVLVWINNGAGNFLPPVSYVFPGSTELNIFDANEDGFLDVVGTGFWPGDIWVMLNNGDGTFTTNSTTPWASLGAQPFQSAVGDLNGDGHMDVAYCCNSPDSFRWAFGDGAGHFTYGGDIAGGAVGNSVHVADLDGDGDVDAVISHFLSNDYYIYLNNGNGTFAAPIILPSVGGASCTTIADFDRDGDLDIMGADEVADVGILFTQVGPNTPGLQQPSCNATLRINQRADGAGYNGTAPVPLHAGASMAVSLSGQPTSLLGIIFLGFPWSTSFLLPPWGLVSIDPSMPFVILTFAQLDSHGEMLVAQSFPASAPIGATLAVQGLILDFAGDLLSNPMQFTIVP